MRSWLSRLRFHHNRVTPRQSQILFALKNGSHLKHHRTLDGTKVYRLHGTSGEVQHAVDAADVAHLESRGLIAGNMKFPAAVYMLTDKGVRMVDSFAPANGAPLSVRVPSPRH